MSDYMWARIKIGGTISRSVLTSLVEFGVPTLPPEGVRSPRMVPRLEMENDEARWGMFEELEAYLAEQAIPFDRVSDGRYEHSPELRRFRPRVSAERGCVSQAEIDRTFLCDHDNRPMVALADVAEALADTQTREELAARLVELCGSDIPSLPPLVVVEAFD